MTSPYGFQAAPSRQGSPAGYAQPAPLLEQAYFQDASVLVSNMRVVLHGTTYPLSGITSVGAEFIPAKRMRVVVFCSIAGLCSIGAANSGVWLAFTIAWGVGGVLAYVTQKNRHFLVVGTASGVHRGLESGDTAYIAKVVGAINHALLQRR